MFVMNTIASVIAVYVHRDYGWTLVRLNGACLQTKLVLNRFHLFILLLKLNIFHFVCVLAEYVCGTIYLKRQYELEIELPLDGAGLNNDMSNLLIPYAVLMSVVFIFYYYFGIEGVQKANIIATVLFLLLTLLIVSINSYLMYVVFNEVEFEFMWISFSLFSGVNIIINIATFIVAVYCIKDFGKEGRAKVFKKMTIPIGATDCQLRPRMEIE